MRQLFIADGVRIDFRILAEDAVHLGRLEQNFGLQLPGTQCRRSVCGHVRVARAAGQNDDAAFSPDGGWPGGE